MAVRQHLRRRDAGTSLIEILVVIVVLLVGILTLFQIFPIGLGVLSENKTRTLVTSMVRSEAQRLQGRPGTLPDVIAPVQMLGAGAFVQLEPGLDPNEFMPPLDDPVNGVGRIDGNGNVVVGGNTLAHWSRMSGPNRVTRIIGETWTVPAPAIVGAERASRLNLNFAPTASAVQMYGNDLIQMFGNADEGIPRPDANGYDPHEYVLVAADGAQDVGNPFPSQDQVWVGRLRNSVTNGLLDHAFRLEITFYVNQGGVIRPVDAVVTVEPGDPGTANVFNYFVFSLPEMLQAGGYAIADYRGFEIGSLRVQRIFQELTLPTAFEPGNPYQFKSYNGPWGMVMVNPTAAEVRVRTAEADSIPLEVNVDYSVYDWRIVRDDFRVPTNVGASIKLSSNEIRAFSSRGVDGINGMGLGGPGNGGLLTTPGATSAVGNYDFVLLDLSTGGVIVGNGQGGADESYIVDKRGGSITFRDLDPGTPGIQGALYVPLAGGGWDRVPGFVSMDNRAVRALYVAAADMAVQPLKAASRYRAVYPSAPVALAVTQMYPGGAAGWGQPDRIYFPLCDVGQKVTVGELLVNDGVNPRTVRDQDMRIRGKEDFGGIVLSYAELPAGTVIDYSLNKYPVRWVKGASLKLRGFYNTSGFLLDGDEVANFERFRRWSESWRVIVSESFEAGASLR